jgi:WhiB family transcriptional regulator, redox-sensing transcriptional regulator
MNAERIYLQLAKAIEEADDIPPCQTTDPEIWFSDDQEGSGTHYRLAKQLCAECPVADLCLEYSLASEEQFGVWGGLTPRERRAMRVARGRTRGRRAA